MSDRKYAVKLQDDKFVVIGFSWFEVARIAETRKFIQIQFEDVERANDLADELNEFPNKRQALRLVQTIVDLQE